MYRNSLELPLVTIITAVRNGEQFIEQAVTSVFGLNYSNLQYIVIDGNSTDSTLEKIFNICGNKAIVVSEPDSGIADAWNKGLRLAKGTIFGFLNADDYYESRTLENVVPFLKNNPLAITYGDTIFIDRTTGCVVEEKHGRYEERELFGGFGFFHTTCFFTRRVLDTVGYFDTRYQIAIDTDWLLRGIRKNVELVYAGNVTCMRTGGVSTVHEISARREYLSQLLRHRFFRKRVLMEFLRRFIKKLLIMLTLRNP